LEPKALAHRQSNTLSTNNELVRFCDTYSLSGEDIYVAMVRGADEFDISGEDINSLREVAYNTHIKPVIDRANAAIGINPKMNSYF